MIQDKTARLYFYNRAVLTCFIAGTPTAMPFSFASTLTPQHKAQTIKGKTPPHSSKFFEE